MDYRREYIKQLETLKEQIKGCKMNIGLREERLAGLMSEGSQDEYLINSIKKHIFSLNYALHILERERAFLREAIPEDIEYRLDIHQNFSLRLLQVFGDRIDLRFHGTSIYFAKEIIRSGEISCSKDRWGYNTSHDLEGYFSVSTMSTIDLAINHYLGLTDMFMPAGCLFVLQPRGDDDYLKRDQMKKVVFKETPDVLVAILTTPENIDRVKGWCMEYGIDKTVVHRFEEFLEKEFSI